MAAAAADLSPEAEWKFGDRIRECITESGVANELLEKVRAAQPTENTPELKVGRCIQRKNTRSNRFFRLITILNNMRRATQRVCSRRVTC